VEGSPRRTEGFDETGEWLPEETVTVFRDYLIGIRGPSRRRSAALSFAQRRASPDSRLTSVCVRALVPGRSLTGQAAELVDMVIFRENTEDVYAGLEVEAGSRRPRSCAPS